MHHNEAAVHVEDRGYLFADGVYEVWAISAGKLHDEEQHFERLSRSLRELRIVDAYSRKTLKLIIGEVIRRNRVKDGLVYLQITRGVAPRNHAFPSPDVPPSLVVFARSVSRAVLERQAEEGVAVVSMSDIRWARCDIKSIALLPNVLAKQTAKEAGAFEGWMIDENGYVTEGTSSNAWIVDQDGNLITRNISNEILSGITRKVVMETAEGRNIKVIERPFTIEEAQRAREAFMTSASASVLPIVQIDGVTVGNGVPGSIAKELRAGYALAQN